MNDNKDSFCEILEKNIANLWEKRRSPKNMLIIFLLVVIALVLISYLTNPLVITSAALAFFAFYTADSNWQANRINLFGLRVRCYHKLNDMLEKIIDYPDESRYLHELDVFFGSTYSEFGFLFDNKVNRCIENIRGDAVEIICLATAIEEIKGFLSDKNIESKKADELNHQLVQKLEKQKLLIHGIKEKKSRLPDIFEQYLSFTQIK